jgi:hypothetical protein
MHKVRFATHLSLLRQLALRAAYLLTMLCAIGGCTDPSVSIFAQGLTKLRYICADQLPLEYTTRSQTLPPLAQVWLQKNLIDTPREWRTSFVSRAPGRCVIFDDTTQIHVYSSSVMLRWPLQRWTFDRLASVDTDALQSFLK